MLFNPKLFDAVWLAIACTAVAVGLAVAATVVVSIVTAIQALRGKTERRPLIIEAFLRQPYQPKRTTADEPGLQVPIDW